MYEKQLLKQEICSNSIFLMEEIDTKVSPSEVSSINWQIKNNDDGIIRYAIQYLCVRGVFIVWNVQGRHNCNLNLNMKEIENTYRSYGPKAVYKLILKPDRRYEKVLVFGSEYFYDVIKNLDVYMRFNSEDEMYQHEKNFDDSKWLNNNQRKKYSVQQLKRDHTFREKVLEAYGYKCAICRCDTKEVLQAAHEKEYEAANTNCDIPEHGICLCANHHLMYDRHLYDINLKTRRLENVNPKVKDSNWYKEFENLYNGKISERT